MLPDSPNAVPATDELYRRPSRLPDHRAENESFRELMTALAREPHRVLQRLVESAATLCGAESAVISMVEPDPSHEGIQKWYATIGRFSQHEGRTFPAYETLSSAAIAHGRALLVIRPGDFFPAMALSDVPVTEALAAPIYEGEQAVGAIWVAHHAPERRFDSEDRRVLESLADLAAVAWRAQVGQMAARESASFLRLVTDRLPVRVAYVDREFRFRFMNDAYERQAGVTREDAAGRTILETMGSPLFETVRPNLERAFAGETHSQEFEADYPAGLHFLRATYVPDIEPGGEVRGAIVQILDITEQRRSEVERRASDERYRAIFESIDEGFCIIEMVVDEAGQYYDFRYLEVNPAFERIAGVPAETALSGKTVRQIVPGYEQFWIDSYSHVARTGETASLVNEVKGLNRWFQVTAARIGGEGSPLVAVVFNDITERKRAEIEQARLLSELATERERLQTLFAMSPSAIAVLQGEEHRFTYANTAYHAIVGRSELLGKTLLEALPEIADQGFPELLRQVMATGEAYRDSETPVLLQLKPDAPPQTIYVNLLYQPIAEADGTYSGVFVHAVDVTDQVEARNAIAQSEELFRTVFEQATDDAILVLDLNRTLTAWNRAAERITGWTAAEVVGKSADITFSPEDRANGALDWETETAAREGRVDDERWHVRKDGSQFWGSGTMNSLHDAEGNVRGYLKVFRDATERHEMEHRIRTLNEELERRVEERTAELERTVAEAEGFNYSISHDLRTPLRAIVSTASILLDELGPGLDAEYRHLLDRQSYNAKRMATLIDELLRLSRLSRVEVQRQPLDMTAKARSVAAEVEARCQVDVQEGMTAHGDPNLVRTVLQNLIGNACKFSPEGSTVWVGQENGVFYVRDEGVGFDLKYATKIFLPFERLVTEAEFPGTGIGLANVKRIVERHHGRVWAESEPGKGATFFFTLGN